MIKPIHAIIVVALLAVGAYLYLEGDLGFLSGDGTGQISDGVPEGTDTCNYGARDIHAALCVLTGKALPYGQTEAYIESLHMTMCSSDAEDFYTVGNYYRDAWIEDGYTVLNEDVTYHGEYTTFSGSYYFNQNGKGIVSGSGVGITDYYGHDTMFIVGEGPLTTFISFAAFINSV